MSLNHSANPLHAAFYADHAVRETVAIESQTQLAESTYRVRFSSERLAQRALPGQFFMVRLAGCNDPLLGRALALYDVVHRPGRAAAIDLVYFVVGKFTGQLAACQPGDRLDVWGPLGNGFGEAPVDHLIMVAGGIGQTPFVALAREALGKQAYGPAGRSGIRAGRVTFCYGVRTQSLAAGLDDFRDAGCEVLLSSDDGSIGHHGLVTEVLAQVLEAQPSLDGCRVVCCGPEPMMEAVARLTAKLGVACAVSLETPMACGVGICFSCVAKVKQDDGSWDYKRTCVEGPIFAAEKIVW